MLASLCRATGAEPILLLITGDSISDLKTRISNALMSADILITTGGVSVGKYDLTKAALTELGAEIFFERLRLKPGKPTVFARLKKTSLHQAPVRHAHRVEPKPRLAPSHRPTRPLRLALRPGLWQKGPSRR
jgi:molybdopterin biosynthesis enzyme